MFLPFVTTRPIKCNDRLINGLFHSRCLDFHVNEKIIILKPALSINHSFDKDQTTEIYDMMAITFLIQLLTLREYI